MIDCVPITGQMIHVHLNNKMYVGVNPITITDDIMNNTVRKKRVGVLNKRNEIIQHAYKNMTNEEAEKMVILLNEFQQLQKHINLI